jgi:hypothetical protein
MAARRCSGEGSIYQRASDGTWVGSIELGTIEGKRQRKNVYGKTRTEVRDKLRAAQNLRDRGGLVADERLTVAGYLDWWVATVLPGTVRVSTAASYDSKIRNHINPQIGHVRLTKLTPAHVHTLLNACRDAGQSPRSVRTSTPSSSGR